MEYRSTDTILKSFEDAIRERKVIAPSTWVDAGLALIALMGEEHAQLAELESQVAKLEVATLSMEGMTAAKAKVITHASDIYKQMRLQKLKCDRVTEMIRLAKKRGQLASDELRV